MNNEKAARQRLSPVQVQRVRINLLRVAGLAVVLGFLMEAILVLGGKDAASVENVSKCYGESDKAAWELNEVGGRT